MHITTFTTAAPPPVVSIGTPLQVVETTKLLCVTIDNRLTWKEHVSRTIASASFQLYLLIQIKSLGTPTAHLRLPSLVSIPQHHPAPPAWEGAKACVLAYLGPVLLHLWRGPWRPTPAHTSRPLPAPPPKVCGTTVKSPAPPWPATRHCASLSPCRQTQKPTDTYPWKDGKVQEEPHPYHCKFNKQQITIRAIYMHIHIRFIYIVQFKFIFILCTSIYPC